MNRKTMNKGILGATILLITMCFVTGCLSRQKAVNKEDYRIFVDSTGREVLIPREINSVVATGIESEITLLAICPQLLVANSITDEKAFDYIDKKYKELPYVGEIYGGKADFNPEELMSIHPDIVIDIGDSRKTVREDMDKMTEKTGIPFVHIDFSISEGDITYRKLGELLNMQKEAEVLADYCRNTYDKLMGIAKEVNKTRALYITYYGNCGVIGKDSYHSECFDIMADNIAVLNAVSNKGTGNPVDIEQIMEWNPDVIILSGMNLDELMSDTRFNMIDAAKNGKCYKAPTEPFNWLGNPPSVQRYLGMLWLADTLYEEQTDYELYEEVNAYFQLFYHCELSEDEYAGMR